MSPEHVHPPDPIVAAVAVLGIIAFALLVVAAHYAFDRGDR